MVNYLVVAKLDCLLLERADVLDTEGFESGLQSFRRHGSNFEVVGDYVIHEPLHKPAAVWVAAAVARGRRAVGKEEKLAALAGPEQGVLGVVVAHVLVVELLDALVQVGNAAYGVLVLVEELEDRTQRQGEEGEEAVDDALAGLRVHHAVVLAVNPQRDGEIGRSGATQSFVSGGQILHGRF